MDKKDLKILFKDTLEELDNVSNDIEKTKKEIDILIDNFDLVNDGVTDDEICQLSSDIEIKMLGLDSKLKTLLADSKKLKSVLNEVKLLKRKRENKLITEKERLAAEKDKLSRDQLLRAMQMYSGSNRYKSNDDLPF